MDNTYSLLERSQSIFLKGVLILLIVIGHNHYLMEAHNNIPWVKDWLYSFHVHAFLWLPFLYGTKLLKVNSVIKSFKRLFIPYTLFFIVLIIMHFFLNHTFDFKLNVWAYVSGSKTLLRDALGMEYLWFLPTMFAVLVLKSMYDTFKYGWIILVISICLYILFSLYLVRNSDSKYFPIGLFEALMNFPLAILFRKILYRYPIASGRGMWITGVLSAIFTFTFLTFHPVKYLYSTYILLLLPLCIFLFLYYVTKILNSNSIFCRFIRLFGEKSMGIYLLSQLIFSILDILARRLPYGNFELGIATFIITITLTMIVLNIVERVSQRLYNTIFV